MPECDSVAVVVDCTFWGSAKNAVVFGERGIYYNNDNDPSGFLPYREFFNRTFNFTGNSYDVSLGANEILSLSGSQVTPAQLIEMLEVLKREALSRNRRRTQERAEGLAAIPGMQQLKAILLEEVVAPLRNPGKYKKYRISMRNGILFYGPPGC